MCKSSSLISCVSTNYCRISFKSRVTHHTPPCRSKSRIMKTSVENPKHDMWPKTAWKMQKRVNFRSECRSFWGCHANFSPVSRCQPSQASHPVSKKSSDPYVPAFSLRFHTSQLLVGGWVGHISELCWIAHLRFVTEFERHSTRRCRIHGWKT